MTIENQLELLRESIAVQVPYTGGVHLVKEDDLAVYYDVQGEERPCRVDLEGYLWCRGKDILDETYRKAGKMDVSNFAVRFDVARLLQVISPEILSGQDTVNEDKFLRAEMYKLNVYGPGSFFKAHKDTPRSQEMIGSLVIVFPTAHEGGALTLEHQGASWVFDSTAELAAAAKPASIAYVAFYGDVTHSVETVPSGYRVTLTYNLYLADRGLPPVGTIQRHIPAPEESFERVLRALLADPTFLPAGGLLAYGLVHQYPHPAPPESKYFEERGRYEWPPSRLPRLLRLLKGGDARIRTVSERVGLPTHVRVLYNSSNHHSLGHDILTDDVMNLEDVDEDYLMEEIEKVGTVVQRDAGREQTVLNGYKWDVPTQSEEERRKGLEVHWVTTLDTRSSNKVGSPFIALGNDANIAYIYGNLGLFVSVPAVGEGLRHRRVAVFLIFHHSCGEQNFPSPISICERIIVFHSGFRHCDSLSARVRASVRTSRHPIPT